MQHDPNFGHLNGLDHLVPTWDIVKKFLLRPFLSFTAFTVCSDLDMRCQFPIRPECVSEHSDVTHQHLFTEDPVYCVPDLSERKSHGNKMWNPKLI